MSTQTDDLPQIDHLTQPDDPALDAAIRRVLRHGHNIDITTIGRRTGLPRRIEFTFHLKALLKADLPATAREITDEGERRAVLEKVARAWNREPESMVRFSPL